jgi:hypothetical protein
MRVQPGPRKGAPANAESGTPMHPSAGRTRPKPLICGSIEYCRREDQVRLTGLLRMCGQDADGRTIESAVALRGDPRREIQVLGSGYGCAGRSRPAMRILETGRPGSRPKPDLELARAFNMLNSGFLGARPGRA